MAIVMRRLDLAQTQRHYRNAIVNTSNYQDYVLTTQFGFRPGRISGETVRSENGIFDREVQRSVRVLSSCTPVFGKKSAGTCAVSLNPRGSAMLGDSSPHRA